MKKVLKNTLTLVFALSLLTSCNTKQNNKEPSTVIVFRDIVLESSKITLKTGDKYQLSPTISNSDETNIQFDYKSLNEDIISVSSVGEITALKEGVGRIEITYQSLRTLCEVNVTKNQNSSLFSFILIDTDVSILEGNSYALKYETNFGGEFVKPEFSYSNYDSNIISIDNMVVKGLKKGSTTIDIVAEYNDETYKCQANIVVGENKPILSINKQFNELIVGDSPVSFTFSLSIGTKVIKTYNLNEVGLRVSDTNIASITSSGLIGLKKGNFKLTVSVNYNGEVYTSEKNMRVREKYYVTDRKTGHKYEVLDGDKITEIPTNTNPDLVFECFTKDNKKFDEPIYEDMTLDIVWSSKTYNFKESNLNAYLSLLESKAYYPFKDMMIDKICNLESASIVGAYNTGYLLYKSEIVYYDNSYTGCSHTDINSETRICSNCGALIDELGWEANFPHATSYYEVGLPIINYTDFVNMKVMYQIKGSSANMAEGVFVGFNKDDMCRVFTGDTYYLTLDVVSTSLINMDIIDTNLNTICSSSINDESIIKGEQNVTLIEKTTFDFNRAFEISSPLFLD